jgi:hypothetical protein
MESESGSANSAFFVLVILFLCSLGVAWLEYQKLALYRTAAVNGSPFDAQNELKEARRQIGRLEAEVLVLRNSLAQQKGATANAVQTSGTPAAQTRPGDIDPVARQRILGSIDRRYAVLFKRLGLSPSQIREFEAIMLNRALVGQDVAQSLQDQGIDRTADPDAYRQALKAATADLDNEIASEFGASAHADYQQYRQTLSQRGLIDNSLQPYLGRTSTPLTDDQEEQLIQFLAQNPGNNGLVSNQAISAASVILSPDQVRALQSFQRLQQTQQTLAQELGLIQKQLNPPPPTAPGK